jgi:hypothetical protein
MALPLLLSSGNAVTGQHMVVIQLVDATYGFKRLSTIFSKFNAREGRRWIFDINSLNI